MNRVRLIGAAGLLAVAGAIAVAAPAQAASDYYVSPSGSDSSAGTSPGAAFATVQKALETAPSGSTIHLASGTYAQDFVTVRPRVTITGPSGAVVKGAGNARVIQVRHDDVTLTGFTVDGLFGSPDTADGYRDKLIYVMSTTAGDGVSRFRLLAMTLRNAGGECVRMRYLVTNSEVAHSRFLTCGTHDFKFAGGGKNGEALYIGTAPEQQGQNGAPDAAPDVSRDNRVHHNTFDTQGNECVDVKENSTANVIEYNTCTGQKDPNSAGFDARGSGNTFRYNVSTANVGAGIRFGGDTPADGTNNSAYGNTITNNAAGGIKFQATPQGRICGNAMSGNTGGNAVGTYASQFNPTAPCAGTPGTLPVSAVDASGHDGNLPANTLDDNLATRWSAQGVGVWIRYDLGATRTVTKVAIAWYRGDQRRSDFQLQVSTDGTSWTTVVDRESSGAGNQPETYDFTDRSARYVRVVGHGNEDNDWTSITEVDIYGS